MGNVERYERILIAAIEIQQLRHEIKERLRVLSKNMTAHELKNRSFVGEDASKAFSIVLANKSFSVSHQSHVQSSLKYKDVEVNLFCHPDKLDSKAMEKALEAIQSGSILDA